MPEIQLGTHTVRSHGARLARVHMHDWLILLLLVVIEVVLNVIEPFHRFVGQEMMTDLKYPLQDNTVPLWAVPVCLKLSFASIIVNSLVIYFPDIIVESKKNKTLFFSPVTDNCDIDTLYCIFYLLFH